MRSLSHISCGTNGDLLCASYVRRGKKMIDRYSKGFSHATFVFFIGPSVNYLSERFNARRNTFGANNNN